ncbi:Cleavage and polyadenylation specificity factor [Spraguea lophii 42_110]|uniref:Endoribonuclease YSH1 n=1 Tax=Spraguea lophii (strain 42_110) TaxID=1358809 RepID=S7XLF7_SPRLO|nr:Cleavage and polyadenylation specificity factor [Spraguea lophii 42_110]
MSMSSDIKITPLGAGNEVGRSCILLEYKSVKVLLDCGVHPTYTGTASLPFLDLIDLSTIDAVFITHFHLDHAGALPFLTEKTGFKGKVFMTYPTKAILRWLLNDFIRIINSSSDTNFYTEQDLDNCYSKIEPLDYHQEVSIKNILKVSPLNAGHVLGAAMLIITCGSYKVLYTGDYSREEDRHLKAAETPETTINVLISESTYGVQCHLPRVERERRFTGQIDKIVRRGGKCLLPVFALGRAQELLLILEEHWEANKDLHKIPIYYASALAKRCMGVYQTYINTMNERIQKISKIKNPFIFNHVKNLKSIDNYNHQGPCVMMASPGMLQSGLSRELFELWCEDGRNGIIIPGYSVNGTLAKEIMSEPSEIEAMDGKKLKLNMSVDYISFSAHVDFIQNKEFINICNPEVLILVHGEFNEMTRLKNVLQTKQDVSKDLKILTPKNGETETIHVEQSISVKIIEGENKLKENYDEIEGILISTTEETKLYPIENIESLSKDKDIELECLTVEQDVKILHNSTPILIKQTIFDFFSNIKIENDYFSVTGVKVSIKDTYVNLSWVGSYERDLIAMTIRRLIKNICDKTSSIKKCRYSKKEMLIKAFNAYFSVVKEEGDRIEIIQDDKSVRIENKVIEGDEELVIRILPIIERIEFIYK